MDKFAAAGIVESRRKKDDTEDRLIWKKAVALWQSRWLWFADRAVFAAFACFFTRHHSETLLSRGAITGPRDEQHAAAVVPRRRWTKTTGAHSTLANTRGTTCIRDYRDNIPDSGPLCEKASDAGCTDGMAATPRRKKKGLKRRKETPRKRTDGWNRISSRENIFRDNSEMTGSSIEVSFEEYF